MVSCSPCQTCADGCGITPCRLANRLYGRSPPAYCARNRAHNTSPEKHSGWRPWWDRNRVTQHVTSLPPQSTVLLAFFIMKSEVVPGETPSHGRDVAFVCCVHRRHDGAGVRSSPLWQSMFSRQYVTHVTRPDTARCPLCGFIARLRRHLHVQAGGATPLRGDQSRRLPESALPRRSVSLSRRIVRANLS